MGLIIAPRVREKLARKHRVSEEEFVQCFANRDGKFLFNTREEHRTDPPTHWFIAQTDFGRESKIIFVPTSKGPEIKSAYEPSDTVKKIHNDHGRIDHGA